MIAEQAAAAIQSAADAVARKPLHYREGKKQGTREYVMCRFPYIGYSQGINGQAHNGKNSGKLCEERNFAKAA